MEFEILKLIKTTPIDIFLCQILHIKKNINGLIISSYYDFFHPYTR